MTNPIENEYDLTGYLTDDFRHIELDNPRMVQMVARRLHGVELEVTIKPFKDKRSDRQNKFWWGVCVPHIQAWLHVNTGKKYKPDEVYAWVRISLLGLEPKIMTILGEEVIVMRDKKFSAMSTKEFAEAVDTIREKMAEKGCIIPEPTKRNSLSEHYDKKFFNNNSTDD